MYSSIGDINVGSGSSIPNAGEKITIGKTIAALALGASLIAGTASAQDTAMTTDVALSMLELAVDRELQKYGFEDQDIMN